MSLSLSLYEIMDSHENRVFTQKRLRFEAESLFPFYFPILKSTSRQYSASLGFFIFGRMSVCLSAFIVKLEFCFAEEKFGSSAWWVIKQTSNFITASEFSLASCRVCFFTHHPPNPDYSFSLSCFNIVV